MFSFLWVSTKSRVFVKSPVPTACRRRASRTARRSVLFQMGITAALFPETEWWEDVPSDLAQFFSREHDRLQ